MKKNIYVGGFILLLATLFFIELTNDSSPDYSFGRSPSMDNMILE